VHLTHSLPSALTWPVALLHEVLCQTQRHGSLPAVEAGLPFLLPTLRVVVVQQQQVARHAQHVGVLPSPRVVLQLWVDAPDQPATTIACSGLRTLQHFIARSNMYVVYLEMSGRIRRWMARVARGKVGVRARRSKRETSRSRRLPLMACSS
jgi:hypothetical protein